MVRGQRESLRICELAGIELSGEGGDALKAKRPKTVLEEVHLKKAFELLGCPKFLYHQQERPDFLVTAKLEQGDARIACELTKLHIPTPVDNAKTGSGEVRLWAIWEKFACDLRKAFVATKEDRLTRLYGAIHLYSFGYDSLDSINLNKLREEIISLVSAAPDYDWLVDFDPNNHPLLARRVSKIWTAWTMDGDAPLWWLAGLQTGLLQNPASSIENIIRVKAAKSSLYEWPDGYLRWLIIIARGRGIHDHVPFAPDLLLPDIDHPFSEIILVELRARYVLQLFPSQNVVTRLEDLLG